MDGRMAPLHNMPTILKPVNNITQNKTSNQSQNNAAIEMQHQLFI